MARGEPRCGRLRRRHLERRDLAEWVRDQAVEERCRRQSFVLEEWYRKEATGNVWHGTCENADTGDDMSFAINVDSVWTPSETDS